MRITNDIRDFISKKVDAKVAKVTLETEYKDAMAAARAFEIRVTDDVEMYIAQQFAEFLNLHPELANSELSTRYTNVSVSTYASVIRKEYEELTKLRSEYVEEVIQRVCIDATSCKDTEELLKLIDKIVGV
jgi:hypothetical protein